MHFSRLAYNIFASFNCNFGLSGSFYNTDSGLTPQNHSWILKQNHPFCCLITITTTQGSQDSWTYQHTHGSAIHLWTAVWRPEGQIHPLLQAWLSGHSWTPSAIWNALQHLGHRHKGHLDNWVLIPRLDVQVSTPTGMQWLFRCPKEPSCCSRCAWVLVQSQQAHLAALAHPAVSNLVRRGKLLYRRKYWLKILREKDLPAWDCEAED